MRKTVATLTAVLALAGCGAGASGSAESSPSPSSYVPGRFEAAKITCRAASPLSDGGKTLTFDTKGEEDTSRDGVRPAEWGQSCTSGRVTRVTVDTTVSDMVV